jgi:hypothetical protein
VAEERSAVRARSSVKTLHALHRVGVAVLRIRAGRRTKPASLSSQTRPVIPQTSESSRVSLLDTDPDPSLVRTQVGRPLTAGFSVGSSGNHVTRERPIPPIGTVRVTRHPRVGGSLRVTACPDVLDETSDSPPSTRPGGSGRCRLFAEVFEASHRRLHVCSCELQREPVQTGYV